MDSDAQPARDSHRCATARRSALSATRDAGGFSHAPGLGSPAAALLDIKLPTHCVFQRKAATDSKGRRAGFQLKAATAEVV